MTKIPAHPKICDGSARLPRPGSLLSACLDVSFCLDKFFHCAVSSGHLVTVASQLPQAVGYPWEPSHPDLRERCNLWVFSTTSFETRPQSLTQSPAAPRSGRANGSLTAKSGSQVSCCRGGTDQPPPVLSSRVRPCPVLLLDRSSSTRRRSRLVSSRLRGELQFEGNFQSWRGGKRPLFLRPLESSPERACVH